VPDVRRTQRLRKALKDADRIREQAQKAYERAEAKLTDVESREARERQREEARFGG